MNWIYIGERVGEQVYIFSLATWILLIHYVPESFSH